MARQLIQSGTEWESQVGYSRAVRTDDTVHVSGTTATDEDGSIVGIDDPYEQMKQAVQNVTRALEAAEASLDDVVRTRIYVTDISHWEAIGRAHAEAFGTVRPAATMVEVDALIDPDLLVELEVTAELDADSDVQEIIIGEQ